MDILPAKHVQIVVHVNTALQEAPAEYVHHLLSVNPAPQANRPQIHCINLLPQPGNVKQLRKKAHAAHAKQLMEAIAGSIEGRINMYNFANLNDEI